MPRPNLVICPRCQQPTTPPVCAWCDEPIDDSPTVSTPPSLRLRGYTMLRGLVRLEAAEQFAAVRHLVEWAVLGSIVGGIAGLSSAGFLVSLDWATRARTTHPWLLWLLPVAGLAMGLTYQYAAGAAARGNALVIDEHHRPTQWLPIRMAPLTFGATVVTHLFGGSAGREGAAIQMSTGLTDMLARRWSIESDRRHLLLVAAVAGGFGAVFGVPVAGCVFALEWQRVGSQTYRGLLPALVASIVGDRVVRGVGVKHTTVPILDSVHLDPTVLIRLVLAGVGFGLAAVAFIELTHGIRRLATNGLRQPLRPVLGGVAIIALTGIVGTRQYLGLSIPLATASLEGGAGVAVGAFALKLLYTSITVGTGYQGGEVTPLFIIGATLGATLARLLHLPIPLLASVGFVAVFAGAANTPVACTIMGIELFGAAPAVPIAICCTVSYLISSDRGIYGTQRIAWPKNPTRPTPDHDTTLNALNRQRRPWLPARPRNHAPTPEQPDTSPPQPHTSLDHEQHPRYLSLLCHRFWSVSSGEHPAPARNRTNSQHPR